MKQTYLKYLLVALFSVFYVMQVNSQDLSIKQKYEKLLSDGMKEAALKNTASSNILFKECITLLPEEPTAYFELAKNYDNIGDGKQAVYYAKRAYSLSPDNLWYEEFLFTIGARYKDANILIDVLYTRFKRDNAPIEDLLALYLASSKNEQAIPLVKEYELKNGRNTRSTTYLAEIYSRTKDYKKALVQVNELCKTDPKNVDFVLQKAFLLSQLNKQSESWKLVEKFYRENPQSGEIAAAILPFYQSRGNYDDLFSAVTVAVSDPKIDVKERMQILLSASAVSKELDKYEDSVEKSLLGLLANSKDFPTLYAYAGEYFSEKKDSVRAFEYQRKAVIEGYDDENYALSLLYKEAEKELFDMLLKDGALVSSKYPNNPHAWYIYSYAARQTKRLDEAILALEKAKKLSQSVSVAFYSEICSILGSYYDQAGNYAKADENFAAALSLAPDHSTTLNNFAYSLSSRPSPDLQKAKKLAEQALKLDPEKAYIMDTYAWILYLLGDHKNALTYIQKAFELDEDQSLEVYEHYKKILLANSMKEQAEKITKKIDLLKSEEK